MTRTRGQPRRRSRSRAGYDPARYELLARYLPAFEQHRSSRPLAINDVMKADIVPNGKTDTNNNGAFSTDYIGGSWDYPEGNYADARQDLAGARRLHPGLPLLPRQRPARARGALHAEMNTWGLCRDEFTDTDHWPHQLYVREARRMVGEYVMTQKDIQTELTKPDAIGMGSYNSDSHNVQRRPTADGRRVENEGDMQVAVTPYQIPYRVLLPKRTEATNLLVPVCFSATPRGLLDAPHGAAVHDPRPGRRAWPRRWRSTARRRGPGHRRRGAAGEAEGAARRVHALNPCVRESALSDLD